MVNCINVHIYTICIWHLVSNTVTPQRKRLHLRKLEATSKKLAELKVTFETDDLL